MALIEGLGKACVSLRYLGSRGHSLSDSAGMMILMCCTYNLAVAAAAISCNSAPEVEDLVPCFAETFCEVCKWIRDILIQRKWQLSWEKNSVSKTFLRVRIHCLSWPKLGCWIGMLPLYKALVDTKVHPYLANCSSFNGYKLQLEPCTVIWKSKCLSILLKLCSYPLVPVPVPLNPIKYTWKNPCSQR